MVELCLFISMFFTGFTKMAWILLGINILGVICVLIAKEDLIKKVGLLFNIPITFTYIYYIYSLVQLLR